MRIRFVKGKARMLKATKMSFSVLEKVPRLLEFNEFLNDSLNSSCKN